MDALSRPGSQIESREKYPERSGILSLAISPPRSCMRAVEVLGIKVKPGTDRRRTASRDMYKFTDTTPRVVYQRGSSDMASSLQSGALLLT